MNCEGIWVWKWDHLMIWANSGYSGRIWEFSIWGIGGTWENKINEMGNLVQFGEIGRKTDKMNKQ
jgi:hypothetical protein